jgi:cobalt/nickel transport system permease protein
MAIILIVQALVLGDGGMAALGANVLNMALLPAGCVAVGRRLKAAEDRWLYAGCGIAAAVSVPLAAALIVVQTALFRSGAELIGWQEFAARMIATHAWIGLAEGGLTLAAVAGIAWFGQSSWKPAIASSIAALALATIALPWSSALPDGYEAAAKASGLGTWLAAGSDTLVSLSSTLGEQDSLIAGALLVGALVAALASLTSPRRLSAG